jgi:AraC-like DNA-binding protein
MRHELTTVLREAVLPMAERLDRERLILGGQAGKESSGAFSAERRAGAAERATQPLSTVVYPYQGHPTLELAFGFQGRAEFALDGRRYALEAGDIAVVAPGVPHQERVLPGDDAYHLVWFRCAAERVTIHSSSYSRGNRFQLVRGAGILPGGEITLIFERAAQETRTRGTAWVSMVRGHLCEGLVATIRHLEQHGLGQTPPEYHGSVVDFAKAYIQAHFSQPLTLQRVAQEVSLSPNYFSSVFAKAAGTTLVEYIQQVRLDEAKRLLREPDLPIREIARRVGIRTPAYFSRLFRRDTGVSARAYRNAPRGRRPA